MACCLLLVVQGRVAARTLVVADAGSREPVEYAQMILSGVKVKAFVHAESDASGRMTFDESKVSASERCVIRRMGYKEVRVDVTALEALPDTVWMEPLSMMPAAVVTGSKSLIRLRPDRMVYDVSRDTTLRGKTAYEILQRLPLLIVSNTGSITTVDDKPIEYKVNGLRNVMVSGDIRNALKSLPADVFQSVEFIHDMQKDCYVVNFGSKFRIEGYRAMVASHLNDDKVRNYVYGLTKVKRFAISGTYSNIQSWGHSVDYGKESFRHLSTNLYRSVDQTHETGYHANKNSVEVSASYDLSEQSVLTVYGRALVSVNPHDGSSGGMWTYNPDGQMTLGLSRQLRRKVAEDNEYTVAVNYEKLYGRNGDDGKFYVGYEGYYRPVGAHTERTYTMTVAPADPGMWPFGEDELYDYKRYSFTTENWQTMQAEYRRTYGFVHTLNVAVQGRLRLEEDGHEQTNSYVFGPQPYEDTEWSDICHDQFYGFLTASYTYQTRLTLVRVALTPVYTKDFYRRRELDNKFSKDFWAVLPSANFNHVFSNRFSAEMSYSMSQNNPGIGALNPYVFRSPGEVQYGNTNLRPQTTHGLELAASLNLGKCYLRFAESSFFSKDLILDYRFMDGDLLHVTQGNIARRYTNRLAATFSARLGGNMTVRFNNSVDYSKYRSDVLGQSNHGFYYRCNGLLSKDFRWNMSVEATGGYNSPVIYFQGKGSRDYWYGLSVTQNLLNSRLELIASASNFVPVRYNNRSAYETDGYVSYAVSRSFHAKLGLTVRYTFGKLKARVKESEGYIRNNDVKYDYSE